MRLQPKLYIDTHDWWIGYYRGDAHHYICVLPCVVLRLDRSHPVVHFHKIPFPIEISENVTEAAVEDEERTPAVQSRARMDPRMRRAPKGVRNPVR